MKSLFAARRFLWGVVGLWSCLALACGAGAPDPGASPVRVYEEHDALWVEHGGTKQMLMADGMSYDAHVSADGRLIAVDVAILSTVAVTRVWARGTRGTYEPLGSISGEAWDSAIRSWGHLSIRDIERPRTRFVAWSEDGVQIEVSGEAPGGVEIRETLTVPLEVSPQAGNPD